MIGIGLLLPARLLPAAARHPRAPAGVLARERPEVAPDGARHGADGTPLMLEVAALRASRSPSRSGGSTSAACRCSSSTRSCRRTTPCSAGRRPPLRGQPRRAARPVRPARDRRRPRAATRSGSSPAVIHLNEGHPALARARARGRSASSAGVRRGGARGVRERTSSSRPTRRSPPGTRPTRPTSSWPPSATSPTGSASTTRSSSTSAASTPARTSRPG